MVKFNQQNTGKEADRTRANEENKVWAIQG